MLRLDFYNATDISDDRTIGQFVLAVNPETT
jgi:hypothetical protein